MKIIEKNKGAKIPHIVDGDRITFGDDALTLNLSQYEHDEAVDIDITRDSLGNLMTGVIPGSSEWFIAQIHIPARKFDITLEDAPPDMISPPTDPPLQAKGEQLEEAELTPIDNKVERRIPIPFDIKNSEVTLTLWAIDSQVQGG